MAKSIISVGFNIPGQSDNYFELGSNQALLDYDVIVFNPNISRFLTNTLLKHQGKPWLDDDDSFALKECAQRWKKELANAYDHGKTIFIFLPEKQEAFVSAGASEGIDRRGNRLTKQNVEPITNYSFLPINFEEIVVGHGREMRPAKDLGPLSLYWSEFQKDSEYHVYFSSKMVVPLLITKTGNKVVGGVVRDTAEPNKGVFILLPSLSFDEDDFTSDDGEYWNKKGEVFGEKLVSALVGLDKAFTSGKQKSKVPVWVNSTKFQSKKELALEKKIGELASQIEVLQEQKQKLRHELDNETSLKRLLFETGEGLEDAILDALDALGLKAERFKNSESEFDSVFTWAGYRFLGEAEGKDSKPINVDKISQLERNINEDFERDEVKDRAKGILFGNAVRLKQISERGDYFTEKCISSSKRLGVALVRTPDLFFIAKYVKESGDKEFSKKCIEAILATEGGVVVFPAVPKVTQEIIVGQKTKKLEAQ